MALPASGSLVVSHSLSLSRSLAPSLRRSWIGQVHDAIPCEFIAIFDADFLPEKDFLLRAMPVFQDKHVGFVQGRWTYLNADESLFCRYQVCIASPSRPPPQNGRASP